MLHRRTGLLGGLTIACLLLAPAARAHEPGTGVCETAGPPAIRNARVPLDGVLSGGQPTPEQIEAAARSGFRSVINLRTHGEPGYEWEPELAAKLGMRYVSIPISRDDLTRASVERIDRVLDEALAEGPVLLHCASGNRIGAVFALRDAWLGGAAPEEALGRGLATGLTSLEPAVREILGITDRP